MPSGRAPRAGERARVSAGGLWLCQPVSACLPQLPTQGDSAAPAPPTPHHSPLTCPAEDQACRLQRLLHFGYLVPCGKCVSE